MSRTHTGIQEWPPHSGRYRLDYYTPDGRRHRPQVPGQGKKALELAQRMYSRKRDEIEQGRYTPPRRERKTFGEVMSEYLASQRGMVSELTLQNDQLRAAHLEPLLGHELIDQINAGLLIRVLAEIKNRKPRNSASHTNSGCTANRYRSLISGIFTFALSAQYIDASPLNPKTVKKYPEAKRRRYASADEEAALRRIMQQMRSYRELYRELEFDLALFTGLRKTEQYSARWSKVDRVNGFMTVLGKSKGHIVERTIPLNPMAIDTLGRLHEVSEGSSFVIPIRRTRRSAADPERHKDQRGWFDDVVEAAGVEDFTWHDLRHTFASRAIMDGVPIATVSEWLGHKSIRTTMEYYAHLSPGHHRDEMAKLKDTRTDTSARRVLQISDSKVVND